jgi:hypothetical protein
VLQFRVLVAPCVTLELPNETPVTLAGATTLVLALPVLELPAALYAVTTQVAVPAVVVPTEIAPEVPDPVAVAPAPEQATDADVAPLVDQLNVLA